MKGRTYRYFEGKPLYPFGHGLSYTTFSYSGLMLPRKALKAGDPLSAEVAVTNTGEREGDEVVQLYLGFPNVAGAPIRALRGFKRIHLKPGESQKVGFELKERDLSMVTAAGEPIIAKGNVFGFNRGRPAEHGRTDSGRYISSERHQGAPGIA